MRAYSPREQRLLSIIRQKGRVSTRDLMKRRIVDGLNARQSLVVSLVNLSKKMKANHEPVRLCRSKRRGPLPIEWWLE